MFVPKVITALTFLASLGLVPANLPAFSADDAGQVFSAYNRTFYFEEGANGYFRATTAGGKTAFWERAEQLEMLLDVYERTTNPLCLAMFSNSFNGFVAEHGWNWQTNIYNDDIMWMVIASARAHLQTGNPAYRAAAKSNFDPCFARAWSTNLGGGLWWRTDNTTKNACVNGPAAIAACLLFRISGDSNYLAKAETIFQWESAVLFDTNSGAIADAISAAGKVNHWASSYNQGTFIGAAHFLGHTNEAQLAADYTMNRLGRDGFLPAYDQKGDLGGFNGICVRWLARFMYDRNLQSRYETWLRKNADAAWNARRPSDGLIWSRWPERARAETLYSWACSSSVVLLHALAPKDNAPTPAVNSEAGAAR